MIALTFLAWMAGAFLFMELLSYVMHRWLFHGPLWPLHRSHHERRHDHFETNDLFSIFFSLIAIGFLIHGVWSPLHRPSFAIGTGMTLYGGCYFLLHDVLTHRRWFHRRRMTGWFARLRKAHLVHHRRAGKVGIEPYGLLFTPRVADAPRGVPSDRLDASINSAFDPSSSAPLSARLSPPSSGSSRAEDPT